MMHETSHAVQLLNREFLEVRSRLIDIAATLDRIQRGGGGADIRNDARMVGIGQALRVLGDGQPDRAERVQLIFSDEYDARWRET